MAVCLCHSASLFASAHEYVKRPAQDIQAAAPQASVRVPAIIRDRTTNGETRRSQSGILY
jgi:hypothetical protein